MEYTADADKEKEGVARGCDSSEPGGGFDEVVTVLVDGTNYEYWVNEV